MYLCYCCTDSTILHLSHVLPYLITNLEIPGGSVVRTRCVHRCDPGSTPGKETKTQQAEQCGHNNKFDYYVIMTHPTPKYEEIPA